jgi:hypothetical protein
MERCMACGALLLDEDEVYLDASGDIIHAKCCGPDPDSYTDEDGQPLQPGQPIPKPWIYGERS